MTHNQHLKGLENDFLYHFGLNTKDHDMKQMFGDIKFVVSGGSRRRMMAVASYMQKQLDLDCSESPVNLAASSDRFVLYKVGPVLVVDHGMGVPSLCIMLNEILKLLHYAECKDVVLFRIGTSGGLGVEPGSVVVSDGAVDGALSPNMEMLVLGKKVERPAVFDTAVNEELLAQAHSNDGFSVVRGTTLCTDDFYEGQGRLDGIFCDYGNEDKMKYLHHLYDHGVRNIEMESICFSSMCHAAGHTGAIACVTFLDRFHGDQTKETLDTLHQWEWRPSLLVARFIRNRLGMNE